MSAFAQRFRPLRRPAAIALTALGALVGFGAGFASLGRSHHEGQRCHCDCGDQNDAEEDDGAEFSDEAEESDEDSVEQVRNFQIDLRNGNEGRGENGVRNFKITIGHPDGKGGVVWSHGTIGNAGTVHWNSQVHPKTPMIHGNGGLRQVVVLRRFPAEP